VSGLSISKHANGKAIMSAVILCNCFSLKIYIADQVGSQQK